MATSEYILLAGIFDADLKIREKAGQLIIKARKLHKGQEIAGKGPENSRNYRNSTDVARI